MNYLSIDYAVFSALLLLIYYLFSRIREGRFQWIVLLAGSVLFYCTWIKKPRTLLLFLIPVVSSYLAGLLLEKKKDKKARRIILWTGILLVAFPLVLFKTQGFFPDASFLFSGSIAVPIGISFYTLQLIAYLSDCYHGKTQAQRNPLKHLLFVSFFPQIIQGPIPRYQELGEQLYGRHSFEYENLSRGMIRIAWGFFLKLMIADKAAVFVNKVFDGNGLYVGGYIIVAALLYAVQLYADFSACTTISRGVAQLFGIELAENFRRPYFAVSISDFWRRWHISLSTWLRDYIYIPLGGNRKGKARKYLNILIVFLISGLWHGSQCQFIVWGLLHAVYQIAGDLSSSARECVYMRMSLPEGSTGRQLIKRAGVFLWVTVGWLFFRSKDLGQAILMFRDAFAYYNPWSVLGAELFLPGLDYREFLILFLSVAALMIVSYKQEHGKDLQEWFVKQHLLFRWCILFLMIIVIWVFGTYGYTFRAQDFIYGGF